MPFAATHMPQLMFCKCWLQVTLLGLWLVPVIISVYMVWWRFILVCACSCPVAMLSS